MKQHFTDERTGISYTLQGDYYLPDLALPAEEQVEVGIWGQRHLQYIKAHRKGFYTTLLTKCELNRHLADVNKQAEDMFFRLVKQMAEREGVTEKLKADNQMEWFARMTNIRSRLRTYEDVISRNNLWSYFSRHRGKTPTKDDAR